MLCVRCGSEIEDFAFCPYCGKRQPHTPPAAKPKRKKRPNGTGTVIKLKQKLKKPYRAAMKGMVVGYYATEKEAYDALARLVDTEVTEKYNWTFKQVYNAWSAEHLPGVGVSTSSHYKKAYELSSALHLRKFRSLRSGDFQKVLDSASERYAETTVLKFKMLFTQMTAWAIKNEVAAKDYATYAEVKGRSIKHHEPFTADEIKKLEADGSEAAQVVLMLLATGMRIGELFSLPLSDYHGDYVIGGEKTEAGRERIIPIRPEGRQYFERFATVAQGNGGKYLINGYSRRVTPASFRNNDYRKLLTRLGIDSSKTPHSARAAYGTRAATEDNLSPAVLQKVMGHSDFNTTQKFYNRPDAETLVKAVEDSAKKQPVST